jgi:hypothetical protein
MGTNRTVGAGGVAEQTLIFAFDAVIANREASNIGEFTLRAGFAVRRFRAISIAAEKTGLASNLLGIALVRTSRARITAEGETSAVAEATSRTALAISLTVIILVFALFTSTASRLTSQRGKATDRTAKANGRAVVGRVASRRANLALRLSRDVVILTNRTVGAHRFTTSTEGTSRARQTSRQAGSRSVITSITIDAGGCTGVGHSSTGLTRQAQQSRGIGAVLTGFVRDGSKAG